MIAYRGVPAHRSRLRVSRSSHWDRPFRTAVPAPGDPGENHADRRAPRAVRRGASTGGGSPRMTDPRAPDGQVAPGRVPRGAVAPSPGPPGPRPAGRARSPWRSPWASPWTSSRTWRARAAG